VVEKVNAVSSRSRFSGTGSSPRERPSKHSPRFSQMLIIFRVFENIE